MTPPASAPAAPGNLFAGSGQCGGRGIREDVPPNPSRRREGGTPPRSDDRPLKTLPAEGRGAGWSQPSGANCHQLPDLDRVEDGIPGGRELGRETSHLLFSQCAQSLSHV